MTRKKTPPDPPQRLTVVIYYATLTRIHELAERYGVDPDEVLREVVEIEMSQRPAGVTLH